MSEDLIIEDFDIESNEVTIEEEIKDGKRQICFKGIFSEADKLNRNHRYYPHDVLKEAVDNMIKEWHSSNSPMIGEIEHSNTSKINLERIAVTFPELSWNEETKQLVGKAVPTDTNSGHIIEGLAKSGIKICFSTRCAGKTRPYHGPLSEGLDNCVEVQPGLRIISIDCVGTPSCQAAITNTVYEEAPLTEEVNNKKTVKEIINSIF